MRSRCRLALALIALSAIFGACIERAASGSVPVGVPIDHILVLFQENRTFDHYFGGFPGAD